ncbi:MAG: MerR family transcriptional regulator [Bacteroidales bacterium]|nr:MerR family transcriptional regulator [Bacteroidales bacterium]
MSDSKNTNISDSKIFFSIGEVAQLFDLNESTLRFWEKEFDHIQPKKTTKGFRQYTKADIEDIRMVYHLVKEKGMTLVGAKKVIRDSKRKLSTKLELLDKLNAIKEELLAIKTEISE